MEGYQELVLKLVVKVVLKLVVDVFFFMTLYLISGRSHWSQGRRKLHTRKTNTCVNDFRQIM